MKKQRRRKCKQCHRLYDPDPRNRYHQYTCSRTGCQKLRHRDNQRRWASRACNADYFRGPGNVERVRAWRKANPGYSRARRKALHDDISSQSNAHKKDKDSLILDALHDDISSQDPVIVGLVATLTGDALHDDIVMHVRTFHHRGQQILLAKGKGSDEDKTCTLAGAVTHDPQPVQLGGP